MGTIATAKRVSRIKRSMKIKTNNIADLESHIANLQVELTSQLNGLRHLELLLEREAAMERIASNIKYIGSCLLEGELEEAAMMEAETLEEFTSLSLGQLSRLMN